MPAATPACCRDVPMFCLKSWLPRRMEKITTIPRNCIESGERVKRASLLEDEHTRGEVREMAT